MKNKVINITIILLLAVFISFRVSIACGELNKDRTVTDPPELELPASFSGTLPSAAGIGATYVLVLYDDHFEEVRWHAEGKTTISKSGTWEFSADTLKLFSDDRENIKSFLYADNHLIPLVPHNELHAESHKLHEVSEFRSILAHHSRLREQGVLFTASGNEPFWGVRIDTENNFTYETPGESFSTYIDSVLTDEEDNEFSLQLNSSHADVKIIPEYCMDTMSGFLFTHTVTLAIDNNTLYGCGTFL